MAFEEAGNNLRAILKNAELCLDQYVTDDLIWRLGNYYSEAEVERSRLKIKITNSFAKEMSVNRDIAALGFLRGDGFGIVSSSFRKNRTGVTEISGDLLELLEQSKQEYPYTLWIPGWKLEVSEGSPLEILRQDASLIGLKALGESNQLDQDGFLMISVRESSVQDTYKAVAYNHGVVVLVDEEDRIISCIGENLQGQLMQTSADTHNIEYPLDLYHWRLCDKIPRQEYLKDAREIRNFGIIIIVTAILLTAVVSVIWSRKYTRPISLLMENMNHIKCQEFDFERPQRLGWEELDQLNEELYVTAQSICDYIDRLTLAERERTKEELLALQYQMNPHFLLNSLNTIRWMAMMTNNPIVADALVALGKMISPMLRNPSLTWKIENELEFLENYVAMMQLRFGHDMEYHVQCRTEWYGLIFPRLILQPLIENCFVHGSSQEEIRTIRVILECSQQIQVCVMNSGVFLTPAQLEEIRIKMRDEEKNSDHIGMSNVYKRLRLLYGDKGMLTVDSDPEYGFIVRVCFPNGVHM